MAVTQNTYTGNGSTTNYSITFPYLEKTDIKVTLNGVLTTAYTFANLTTIAFTTAPANGVAIRIYRETDVDALQSTFFAGSAIRAQDLNDNFSQSNYCVQEIKDRFFDRTGGTMVGSLAMSGNKITGVGDPTAAQDAATKNYVDTRDSTKVSKAGDSMTGPLAMGNNKITGLADPNFVGDAATKNYVDNNDFARVAKSGDSMTGSLNMQNNKVTSLGAPSSSGDAATKGYVDGVLSSGIGDGDKGDITVSGLGTNWSIDNGVITPAKLSTGGPSWNISGGLGVSNSTPLLTEGISFTDTIPSSFTGANRISFGQTGGIVRNGIGVSGVSPNTRISYLADDSHAFYNYQFGTLQQVAQLDKRLMLGGVGTYSFAGTTRLVVQGNNTNDTTEGIIDLIRGSNASTGNVLGRIQFRDNYATPQSYYASIGCVAEAGPSPTSYLGALTFSTNTTGSATPLERMRIDSSGRMLVGTSSSSAGTRAVFQGQSSGAGSGAQIHLQRDQAAGSIGSGQPLGIINFADNAANVFATVSAVVDATEGTNDYPGRLVFSTTADGASSPTEAMRINNKGQVGINYSGIANGRGLFIKSSSTSSADYTIYTLNNAETKLDFGYRNDGFLRAEAVWTQTNASSANVFVDSNGFLYRSTSSERYKRDIVAAPYTLEQIDQLRAVNYKTSSPNADGEVSDQVFGGLIAEEVNEAGFEEFVVFDDQGRPDALQYGQMIAVAIKGLQEAHARIKELEAKVAALESA